MWAAGAHARTRCPTPGPFLQRAAARLHGLAVHLPACPADISKGFVFRWIWLSTSNRRSRRNSARFLSVAAAVAVLMMIIMSYFSPYPMRTTAAWFWGYLGHPADGGAGSEFDRSTCALMCPNLFYPDGSVRHDVEGVERVDAKGRESSALDHGSGVKTHGSSFTGHGSAMGLGSGATENAVGAERRDGSEHLEKRTKTPESVSTLPWTPEVQPVAFSCQILPPSLPIPCPTNITHSDVLTMPPISFLRNFQNPCWYEPIYLTIKSTNRSRSNISNDKYFESGGQATSAEKEWKTGEITTRRPSEGEEEEERRTEDYLDLLNPYRRNMFVCFSAGAQHSFQEMADLYYVRRMTSSGHQQTNMRLRCLPYVYIAGMPKSGSTDLFKKTVLHPDVVRPPIKEPHWWSKNRFGVRLNYTSCISFRDYLDLFDKSASQIERRTLSDVMMPNDNDDHDDDVEQTAFHPMVTVDASASTFWCNDEWWRLPENCGRTEPLFTNAHYIRHLTPQARFIVILRNPTERLYSDYLFFTKGMKSLATFHAHVVASIDDIKACVSGRSLRECVYDKYLGTSAKVRLRVGIYHIYLSEWLKVFPKEQLLVLRTEDYAKNVRNTMRLVFRFLGLRPMTEEEENKLEDMPKANTRKQKDRQLGAMLDSTRQILQDFYRPHNQILADLLQDNRYLWDDYQVATQEWETQSNSKTSENVKPSVIWTESKQRRTKIENDEKEADVGFDNENIMLKNRGSESVHHNKGNGPFSNGDEDTTREGTFIILNDPEDDIRVRTAGGGGEDINEVTSNADDDDVKLGKAQSTEATYDTDSEKDNENYGEHGGYNYGDGVYDEKYDEDDDDEELDYAEES